MTYKYILIKRSNISKTKELDKIIEEKKLKDNEIRELKKELEKLKKEIKEKENNYCENHYFPY